MTKILRYGLFLIALLVFLGCQKSDKPKIKDKVLFESYPAYGDGIDRYLEIEICYPNTPEIRTIKTEKYEPWILEENGTYKVVILENTDPPKSSNPMFLFSPEYKEWQEKVKNKEIYDKVLFSAKVPIIEKDRYNGRTNDRGKMIYYRDFDLK